MEAPNVGGVRYDELFVKIYQLFAALTKKTQTALKENLHVVINS